MAETTSPNPNPDSDNHPRDILKSAPGTSSPLTLAERFLIDVARQGAIGDAAAAAVVISVLATSRDLMHSLAHQLEDDDFSLGRLLTLVTLKALAPLPSTAAELADHVDLTRPTMTGILDHLQRRGWITRARHVGDRRHIQIRLTPKGLRATDRLITDFLLTATSLLGAVPASTRAGLVADYRALAANQRLIT